MPTYDPEEMQNLADQFETRARAASVYYPAYGTVLSALAGGWWYLTHGQVAGPISLALFGAITAFRIGRARTLALSAQAQSLLCQLRIEENTRKQAAADSVIPTPATSPLPPPLK